MTVEDSIVKAIARDAAWRVTRKVVRALQLMDHTLSGDDSELKTTWDEICVQVQYEESFCWDAYDATVRGFVDAYVSDLQQHEREALWLQTDEASEWDSENWEKSGGCPVVDDDIVNYLVHDFVYAEAGRWSNARIRAFIERSSMRD